MGTGYVRQAAADIQDGQNVVAAPLTAEFDAIAAFASGTSGHSHDGTSGEGPKISLTTSVSGTLPVANGGTGAVTAAAARTALGIEIGTNVQAYDAELTAIAALTPTDSNVIVGNGTTWVVESGATARASLGVTIGTDVQAYDADLAAIAALTSAADKVPYSTGISTWALADFTVAARTFVAASSASAQIVALGITATAAELNVLDGITASTTELNYVDGVTSAIQTQLDTKLASSSYTAADVLAKLLTVDGATSGIDAQYLAGQPASFYAPTSGTPAGAVMAFAMNTAPTGWLKCNGAAVSRTTYADLFTAISTTYGVGDGSTTFNLPDLRGEFIRGWADDRAVDTGRVFGSAQSDANLAHTHTASSDSTGSHTHTGTTASDGSHTHSGSTSSDGAHSHTVSSTNGDPAGVATRVKGSDQVAATDIGTSSAGTHSHSLSINSGGAHTHTFTTAAGGTHSHVITVNSSGGTESRPRNIALLYCIKT